MAQNADAKILQARAEISLLNLCRAQLNFLQSYNFFRRWQRKCRFIFSSCMVTAQKLLSFYLLSFTFYLSPFILYLLPFILYLLPFILYLLPFIFHLLSYTFYLLSYTLYLLSFTMGSKKKSSMNFIQSPSNPHYRNMKTPAGASTFLIRITRCV